jgi:hypothetical protein
VLMNGRDASRFMILPLKVYPIVWPEGKIDRKLQGVKLKMFSAEKQR